MDKWNKLNSNYNKLYNYHKGTKNHTSFWELAKKKKIGITYLANSTNIFIKQLSCFKENES
jgi:hypothetical protein